MIEYASIGPRGAPRRFHILRFVFGYGAVGRPDHSRTTAPPACESPPPQQQALPGLKPTFGKDVQRLPPDGAGKTSRWFSRRIWWAYSRSAYSDSGVVLVAASQPRPKASGEFRRQVVAIGEPGISLGIIGASGDGLGKIVHCQVEALGRPLVPVIAALQIQIAGGGIDGVGTERVPPRAGRERLDFVRSSRLHSDTRLAEYRRLEAFNFSVRTPTEIIFHGTYTITGSSANLGVSATLSDRCGLGTDCEYGHTGSFSLSLPGNGAFMSDFGSPVDGARAGRSRP